MSKKRQPTQDAIKPEVEELMSKNSESSTRGLRSIWHYMAAPILILAIIPFLIFALIYGLRVVPTEQAHQQTLHQYQIDFINKDLTQLINGAVQTVETLATNPDIIQSLQKINTPSVYQPNDQTTSQALTATEFNQDISTQFVLFPKGRHGQNLQAKPPITFVMITNANNAQRSGSTILEADEDNVYITVQVQNEQGKTIGAIQQIFAVNNLFNQIAVLSEKVLTQSLAIRVSQEVIGSKRILWQTNKWQTQGTVDFAEQVYENWTLEAQTVGSYQLNLLGEIEFILIALLATIIGIGFLVIAIVLFKRAEKDDLDILRDSMLDIFRGQKPTHETFRLKQFFETYENIYDNLKNKLSMHQDKRGLGSIPPKTGKSQPETDFLSGNPFEGTTETAAKSGFSREKYQMNETSAPTHQADAGKPTSKQAQQAATLPKSIFRAYDIRGIYQETLTEAIVAAIGQAIGSAAIEAGTMQVAVGRDGRNSGPKLMAALQKGLVSSGVEVIHVGMVPTPVLYYAADKLAQGSGVMLTGSHNPANYNGLKIMVAGKTLYGDDIQGLYQRIIERNLVAGKGKITEASITEDYSNALLGDIVLARPLKVAIDCGNGVTGMIAPQLFEDLGIEVKGLYTDIDGDFPNHAPDPSQPENLKALCALVAQSGADLGIAFDGDGDRVGVVTSSGKSIYSDQLMMLFAEQVLANQPGAEIIFDVKCSSDLAKVIRKKGGKATMWKTGHSLIKAKLKETGAPLAGEMSGHIFFKDRWNGFDDALYAAARLMEQISASTQSLDELLAEYPVRVSTPELHVNVTDENKFDIIERLKASGDFGGGHKNEIDGLRVDFENGWGLLRASNTTPVLVARFEADNEEILNMIQAMFRENLQAVAPDAVIKF